MKKKLIQNEPDDSKTNFKSKIENKQQESIKIQLEKTNLQEFVNKKEEKLENQNIKIKENKNIFQRLKEEIDLYVSYSNLNENQISLVKNGLTERFKGVKEIQTWNKTNPENTFVVFCQNLTLTKDIVEYFTKGCKVFFLPSLDDITELQIEIGETIQKSQKKIFFLYPLKSIDKELCNQFQKLLEKDFEVILNQTNSIKKSSKKIILNRIDNCFTCKEKTEFEILLNNNLVDYIWINISNDELKKNWNSITKKYDFEINLSENNFINITEFFNKKQG